MNIRRYSKIGSNLAKQMVIINLTPVLKNASNFILK